MLSITTQLVYWNIVFDPLLKLKFYCGHWPLSDLHWHSIIELYCSIFKRILWSSNLSYVTSSRASCISWIFPRYTVNFRSLKYRKAVLWYTLPRRITWNLKVLVFLKTILVKVYLLLSICWNYCMSVYLWAIWGNIVLQNFSLLFWKLNAENSAFL